MAITEVLVNDRLEVIAAAKSRIDEKIDASFDRQLAEITADPDESTKFNSVVEFVDDVFIVCFARDVDNDPEFYWCLMWFEYAQAVARLTALWRQYEFLRRESPATGMETWWVHHADHHSRFLFSKQGLFSECRREHSIPPQLPVNLAPGI